MVSLLCHQASFTLSRHKVRKLGSVKLTFATHVVVLPTFRNFWHTVSCRCFLGRFSYLGEGEFESNLTFALRGSRSGNNNVDAVWLPEGSWLQAASRVANGSGCCASTFGILSFKRSVEVLMCWDVDFWSPLAYLQEVGVRRSNAFRNASRRSGNARPKHRGCSSA